MDGVDEPLMIVVPSLFFRSCHYVWLHSFTNVASLIFLTVIYFCIGSFYFDPFILSYLFIHLVSLLTCGVQVFMCSGVHVFSCPLLGGTVVVIWTRVL